METILKWQTSLVCKVRRDYDLLLVGFFLLADFLLIGFIAGRLFCQYENTQVRLCQMAL